MPISIYMLKPHFQRLLAPVLAWLQRRALTPNQITIATCLLCLSYAAALAIWPQSRPLWCGLPLLLFLRMALNALDGMLAKASGMTTPLGALLNEVCDVLADAAIGLAFCAAPQVATAPAVAAAFAALLAEFSGLCALAIGVARRFDGPMGKSDRAFAYGAAALVIGYGRNPQNLLWLMAALSILTAITRLHRALAAYAPATP